MMDDTTDEPSICPINAPGFNCLFRGICPSPFRLEGKPVKPSRYHMIAVSKTRWQHAYNVINILIINN